MCMCVCVFFVGIGSINELFCDLINKQKYNKLEALRGRFITPSFTSLPLFWLPGGSLHR